MKVSYVGAALLLACASIAWAAEPPAKEKETKNTKEETVKKALAGKDAGAKVDAIRSIATGEIGDKTWLDLVVPHLEDKSEVAGLKINMHGPDGEDKPLTVEVRDIALAAALQLTKQELQGYGLMSFKVPQGNAPTLFFFLNAEARDNGFSKWNQWAKENLAKKEKEKDAPAK